jgi:hypothetical protein
MKYGDARRWLSRVRISRLRVRLSKFWHSEFNTYKQVWLAAPLGFGVPGFAVSLAFGRSLVIALVGAATITLVGGLGQSYRLWRRRGGY